MSYLTQTQRRSSLTSSSSFSHCEYDGCWAELHLLIASYLRLVADEDVILHRVGDVVHSELEKRPLWDVDQTDTCPGGAAVQRVGPRDYGHSLKKQEYMKKSGEELVGLQ